MGLLYTRRGMGVYVNKGVDSKCREEVRKQIVGRLHEVTSEAKAAGFSPADIKAVVEASLKGDGSLYGDTPSSLLGMAKGTK